MNYEIVFFDVDGTLTNHEDGSVPNSTKEAIRKLKNKGIKVVAATGRPLSMCEEIKDLGIDTFITANGAYATHHQHVIHKVVMDKNIVREVSQFAYQEGNGLLFFSEELNMNGIKNTEIAKAIKETLSLNEYPPKMTALYNQEIHLMCLYANEESVEKYKSKFPHLTFQRWHPFISNVLQEEVSKSLTIKKVLQYFSIDKSEAIAFGDGENDLDMLELVGLGIAMENGSDQLKNIADYVTKKSSEDGIYFALDKFGIILDL